MAKDKKRKGKSDDRPADTFGRSGVAGGLRARRKAIDAGQPERGSEAFREGLSGKDSGDGTGGRREND